MIRGFREHNSEKYCVGIDILSIFNVPIDWSEDENMSVTTPAPNPVRLADDLMLSLLRRFQIVYLPHGFISARFENWLQTIDDYHHLY